jgi:polyhydroxybutyrate depolymerase
MKKKYLLLVILLLITALQLLAQLGSGERYSFEFMHQDLNRSFNVYVPQSYNPNTAIPMVLCLHPGGLFNDTMNLNMERYTHFDLVADTANFILVFPNGTDQVYGTWEDNYQYGVDDIGFLLRVKDTVLMHFNINEEEIFMTGFSRGAYMTYTMACTHSELFKAIAPVSGQKMISFNCNPSLKIPLFHIHGNNDNDAVYQGDISQDLESVPNVISFWVNHNDCQTNPIVSNLPDLDPNDFSTVTKFYYTPNSGGEEVIHYRVNNGGHFWPGSFIGHTSEGIQGAKNNDIDASIEIWKFFRKYISPVTTIYEKPKDPSLKVYPNPVYAILNIENPLGLNQEFVIYNSFGKIVLTGHSYDSNIEINVRMLSKGFYTILYSNTNGLKQRSAFVKM